MRRTRHRSITRRFTLFASAWLVGWQPATAQPTALEGLRNSDHIGWLRPSETQVKGAFAWVDDDSSQPANTDTPQNITDHGSAAEGTAVTEHGSDRSTAVADVAADDLIETPFEERELRPCSTPDDGLRGTFAVNLWPDGIVPFEFDGNVSLDNRLRMLEAMDEIEIATCIDFVERVNDEGSYLHIQDDATNSSLVGRWGGSQDVNIFNWNATFIMVHELMHACGVHHEQQRPDRDSFVAIEFGNIPLVDHLQFVRLPSPFARRHFAYDFDSVMHYGACDFSTCSPCDPLDPVCRTISVLPPHDAIWQARIGQVDHMSSGDIAVLTDMYCRTVHCSRQGHSLRLSSYLGGLLASSPEERFAERTKARSRRKCVERNRISQSWASLPAQGSTLHVSESIADRTISNSSRGYAESGAEVSAWTDHEMFIELTALVEAEPTKNCSRSSRGKRAKAVARAKHKVRVRDLPFSVEPWWNGLFKNCASTLKRSKRLSDPVDIVVTSPNGVATRYPIVDVNSHVWDNYTSWYVLDGVHWLGNTAHRMSFTASIGSSIVPVAQHGYLQITADNGLITSLSATGVFSPMLATLPAVGGSSTFVVEFPPIVFTLDQALIPPGATVDLEGGGGSRDDALGPDTIIGCNLATNLFAGSDDTDLSSPQNGDTSLGFPAGSGAHRIAQEITVPATLTGPLAIESLSVPVYQLGMPEISDPTVLGGVLNVYDGPPWSPSSNLLFSRTTLPVAGEEMASWEDIHRTAPETADPGDRSIFELSLDGDFTIPFMPGDQLWVEIEVLDDPTFGEPHVVPCPFDSGAAYGYDVAGAAWSQLVDAGSGRPITFGLDVVFSDPSAPCTGDCNDDGIVDLADLASLLAQFGGPGGSSGCDFNGDGAVDLADLAMQLAVFGSSCP